MYEELYAPLPDIKAYLDRIGLSETPILTPEGLDELVFAHQKAVPFENYELCELGGHIDISIEKLFDKVVTKRRGGYCFELNGIFCSLLTALGFDAYPVLCKIFRDGDGRVAPLHRCNIVRIDGKRYFTDVGFGGPMPAGALLLEDGIRQPKRNGIFGMKKAENEQWIMGRWVDGEWSSTIKFSNYPSDMPDFIAPNYFCSDVPDSFFRVARLANLYTDDGFYSVENENFKIVSGGETKLEVIESHDREMEILRDYFGIVLR